MRIRFNLKTYDADFCGVGYRGRLILQVHDGRLLSEIAPEIEGCHDIAVLDDDDKEQEHYENFTQLMRIERIDDIAVEAHLMKVVGDAE